MVVLECNCIATPGKDVTAAAQLRRGLLQRLWLLNPYRFIQRPARGLYPFNRYPLPDGIGNVLRCYGLPACAQGFMQ